MTLKVGLKFGSPTFFSYLCIVKQNKQYLSDTKKKINNLNIVIKKLKKGKKLWQKKA